MEFKHITVLREEMISSILTDKNGIYADCTLGGAGHLSLLSEKVNDGALLIGIDQDKDALQAAKKRMKECICRLKFVHSNFSNIKRILIENGLKHINGFIFDLGVSSYQLDEASRGFSYMHEGNLDMRMNQNNKLTAYDVVNNYSQEKIEFILKEYGEERWAKRIAQFIIEYRRTKNIEKTSELVRIIKAAIPLGARKNGPHPAKRTFQAIRIEVNNELGIIDKTINDCVDSLVKGGRIGIITFQSLEDRIVKRAFKELARECICPPELPLCVCNHKKKIRLIGKGIRPTEKEVEENPRSRSATLRVAEKI